jgi:transposase-like protein
VGRPRKWRISSTELVTTDSDTTGTCCVQESTEISCGDTTVESFDLPMVSADPKPKLRRGQYRSYSLQFKLSVVEETAYYPLADLATKYNIPRSTISSWEQQLRKKTINCPETVRGAHLRSGSGRQLSYPKEVDDELFE